MKNKKVIIILATLIVLIGGVFLVNSIYQNKNKINKTKRKRQNNLAIIIKDANGVETTSENIPKGNYFLNEEKTHCENNGKILNYDNTTGKISFSFIGSDRCYLYFDTITDFEKPVIKSLNVSGSTVVVVLTDNQGLSGYGISTSNTKEPSSWTSISGTSYNLSTSITTEGTYYLWVKDSSGNKTSKEFTISLGTSFETLMVANNTDIFEENGLRYEGADPNNYICLDNKTSGACANSSLLFRIIGLFDEDTSNNGTTSAGSKKLLKIIDTNNYGGTEGKYWNSAGTNNWSTSSLKTELNGTYLTTLLGSSYVNSKLSSAVANAKWHLGGANNTSSSNYYNRTITTEKYYKAERSPYTTSGTLQNLYIGNPEYVFAKVGLMYPSDYGYATVGGTTTNKSSCRAKELYSWNYSLYSDCINNDWLFKSATFISGGEWFISPGASTSYFASNFYSSGYVDAFNAVEQYPYDVRPTFYLDSSILKIVGGTGTSADPYHIG